MINYYFFQFIKKNGPDRGPSRGGPAPRGQRWDEFDFFEFGPPRTDPCGSCGTVDREPPGFGPNQTGPFANLRNHTNIPY
jgi:hypothetical protein